MQDHTLEHIQQRDEYWMTKALRLAAFAQKKNEIPVGAVLVRDDKLLAVGCNLSIAQHDPSAHAEMIAMRRAGQRIKNYRLIDSTLYVTLEPCSMCAGLLVHARVARLVFGAQDLKTGSAGSVMNICQHEHLNHQLSVTGGVLAQECASILSAFFKHRRQLKKEQKQHT